MNEQPKIIDIIWHYIENFMEGQHLLEVFKTRAEADGYTFQSPILSADTDWPTIYIMHYYDNGVAEVECIEGRILKSPETKTYMVVREVIHADTYFVEAESPDDAKRLVLDGDVDIDSTEFSGTTNNIWVKSGDGKETYIP